MQGDNPDGSFSAAELSRLEGEGIIEIHEPGSPGARQHAQEMRAQLQAVDEDLRRREGPDAVTSDRLLRQAAIAAEQDPGRIGHALASFCRRRGWERSDLADWLGLSLDRYAALALERRGLHGCPGDDSSPQVDLAERYGADPARLAAVLDD
jgi:hypothetical protein